MRNRLRIARGLRGYAARAKVCSNRIAAYLVLPTVLGRGDARFVLAELAWCRRQAREHLSMHARMNTSCTTAWTACSPDVLGGRRKAVELTDNGYLWMDKSWAVAYGGGACRGAMASIALPHVSTENDRQINLSQRVLSTRCERLTFASL